MKKPSPTKNYPLYIVVIASCLFFIGYLFLRYLSYQSGDLNSVCEANIVNAQLRDLSWPNGPTTFYYLDYRGIVSQLSNTDQSTVVVPGVINNLYVAEKIGKLAFMQDHALWTVNLDGTDKTNIMTFPTDQTPFIYGLSQNDEVLLIGLRKNEDLTKSRPPQPDLYTVNLLTKKNNLETEVFHEIMGRYQIDQMVHAHRSLSPDGTKNIELQDGKFIVDGKELFHCGTVRGSFYPSGPACFRHDWLADNDHIVLNLCGTVIAETSTGKVARLNGGSNVDWLGKVE
ncbi:MAG TPA: hypothetical protein VF209_01495 [Patescibacteria group bacterium]